MKVRTLPRVLQEEMGVKGDRHALESWSIEPGDMLCVPSYNIQTK